jgi:3',5'-cyclic AMP phosphodiesterase CpdA
MAWRHWAWMGVGGLVLVVGVGFAVFSAFPFVRWTEDFFPGTAPDAVLEPEAWTITNDTLTFAIVGDTGTGGRNQMDVARGMVAAYEETPYPVVIHVGDVSYYGSIADRADEVWWEPYQPLHDAGVQFEVAVGNHELEETISEEADQEIAETLALIGEEGSFYSVTWGPVEFFVIDTSTPQITGNAKEAQVAWLEDALAASTATWKVAVMHDAPYSASPKRGSNLNVREATEPLFVKYGVDLALTGHNHIYERTHPQQGVTYVVTGAGAKVSDIGDADFIAATVKGLQFMMADVDGDTMRLRAINEKGEIIDQFELAKGAS